MIWPRRIWIWLYRLYNAQPKVCALPLPGCAQRISSTAPRLPIPEPKRQSPRSMDIFIWSKIQKGISPLHRREERAFGGNDGISTSAWDANPDDIAIHPPLKTQIGTVHHSFTHFNLMLRVMHIKESRTIIKRGKMDIDGQWVPKDKPDKAGLPRVFNKALVYLKEICANELYCFKTIAAAGLLTFCAPQLSWAQSTRPQILHRPQSSLMTHQAARQRPSYRRPRR